jgi:type I restriction enzyme M protein
MGRKHIGRLILNSSGSVQQNLEPVHVQDILIPIPNDWKVVNDVVEKAKKTIEAMEQ